MWSPQAKKKHSPNGGNEMPQLLANGVEYGTALVRIDPCLNIFSEDVPLRAT